MRIFCDPGCLRYHTPGHPESPERVNGTIARLSGAGHGPVLPDYEATPEDVRLAHDEGHLERVRDGGYTDPDTPHYDGIDGLALRGVSASIAAARTAAAGDTAFALVRPPGHHAGRCRAGGFCYLNNVAVACRKIQSEGSGRRIGILDFDAHHGDGTQDIMLGRSGVLFASLHQSPLYPGTGQRSEDNCLNFPLPPGTEEAPYLRALEEALTALTAFRPEVIAVSAGFDAYKDDPIAQLRLEKTSFRRIGALLAQTRLKRFAVLEGGYAPDLPVLVENFLESFL